MTDPNQSSNRSGQLRRIRTGIYNSWEDLAWQIVRIAKLKQFYRKFDLITQKLTLTFEKNIGLSFQGNEIRGVLGFKCTPDSSHSGVVHIGYKKNVENGNRNAPIRHLANFPVDITCESQLIFCLHRHY